ncbi:MAG: BolA family transcriptional regulator [Deltaproteobacteria bacterium]|nr:MAG: BolA family transcriptional regulator [Deltaproteobacteria bacterium]
MIEPNVIEERIRENVPGVSHLALEDLTGGKDHYKAVVVSAAFDGKSRVQQHQMVYRALGELMAGPVHALALQTYTPEAWGQRGKSLL